VVGHRYASWREQLIEALAFIEAENDFPDEDLPGALAERARPLIQSVLDDLHGALASAGRGRSVREGYRIALVGAPTPANPACSTRSSGVMRLLSPDTRARPAMWSKPSWWSLDTE
jgi:hypothetical protein